MKKMKAVLSAIAISTAVLCAGQTYAATTMTTMHYGAPSLNGEVGGKDGYDVNVTNWTLNTYNVQAWDSQGTPIALTDTGGYVAELYPYGTMNPPYGYNIIINNNPPLSYDTVEVTDAVTGQIVFNQQVAFGNNVNIGNPQMKSTETPVVSVSK